MLLQSKLPGAGRLRVVTAGSLVGLFLIGTAHASGPPVGFDGYSVASGTVAATPCASLSVPGAPGATIECLDGMSDDGMFQRKLIISGAGAVDGTYIQFILTDSGVTGDPTADPFTAGRGSLNFTNEDFVKQNNTVAGISSKQVIVDSTNLDPDTITTSTVENRIVLSTQYNFGWAQSNADPWVMITQDVQQLDYSSGLATPTEIMSTNMMLENNSPPEQWHTNSKMRIDQRVDLTESGQGAGAQGFAYATAVGSYQPMPHSAATGAFGTNGPLLPSPPATNGGDPGCQVGETSGVDCYDWGGGDELRAVWVGQWLEEGAGGSDGYFGLTKYIAVHPSTGFQYPTQLVSFADPTAVNWDVLSTLYTGFYGVPGLGPQPTLVTTPVIVAATDDGGFNPPDPLDPPPNQLFGVAGSGASGPQPAWIDWLDPNDANFIYNRWTVASGTISAPCPVLSGHTVVCGATTGTGGFLQRGISIDGEEYIQTIVAEDNATGNPATSSFDPLNPAGTANGWLAFKDENIIKLGAGQGVAYNLGLAEQDLSYLGSGGPLPTTAGQFEYVSRLKAGWAHTGPLDPVNEIHQRLLTPQTGLPAQVTTVDYDFNMLRGETNRDQVIWMSDQVGVNTNSSYPGPLFNIGEPIMFQMARVGGAFNNTDHTAGVNDVAGMVGNTLLPSLGGGAANDIGWTNGETIAATWVGGIYTSSDPFGYSVVGSTSYRNLSSSPNQRIQATVTDQSVTVPSGVDPESWVAPFSNYVSAPSYTQAYAPPPF